MDRLYEWAKMRTWQRAGATANRLQILSHCEVWRHEMYDIKGCRHGDRQVIAQRAGVCFLSLSYIIIYIIAFWAGVSRGTIPFL